jgi:hypothetical protein
MMTTSQRPIACLWWLPLLLCCQASATAEETAADLPATRGAPDAPPHSGPPAVDPPPEALSSFSGRVEQRLRAGSYSYLLVRADAGRVHWVVTLGDGVAAGLEVDVRSFGARDQFRSRRLGRTFEHLLFAMVSRRG